MIGTSKRSRWTAPVSATAAVIGLLLLPVAGQARGAPDSFADLAARLSPAVVNISTTQVIKGSKGQPEFNVPPGSPFEEFFKEFLERNRPKNRGARRVTSLGSGFIIDSAGLVVTNNHVIAEADEINVRLSDGTLLKAKLVGRDVKTDLALLKVEPKGKGKLPALKWGDSDTARVGDWVLAIGNPFGLGGSVTAGIISARNRDINSGPYDDFFQTDAAINRGNSGGPLFNLDGEVIGINTAIYSPSGGSVGIGFAIPSALANRVIRQLAEFGRTRRGWLGVRIQTVTDEIAEGLGLDKATGALVAGVGDDGPAGKAGIQQGDVILRFDGKEVEEMRALPRIVAETRIGKTVKVEIWRKGKRITLEVSVAEMEEDSDKLAQAGEESKAAPAKDVELLGMRLSALTDDARATFKFDESVQGVLVLEVAADSSAAKNGLRPGDLIVEVQQVPVSTPDDVAAQIEKIRKANKARKAKKVKSVLLLVQQRTGNRRFVAVKLDEKSSE